MTAITNEGPDAMDITSHIEAGLATLTLDGRLDFATSRVLEKAAADILDGGTHRILIDMAAVPYVSSAGLRAILVAAKAAQATGGGIAIHGLQPMVADVFITSGFGQIVILAETGAEARDRLLAGKAA